MKTSSTTHNTSGGWRVGAWLAVFSIALIGLSSPSLALTSYDINFSGGTAPSWSTATGTFGLSGGTYNATAYNTTSGLAISTYTGTTWNTNYIYRATVAEAWPSMGNRIGLAFNYVDSNDYYYVLFDNVGYAELDKVVSGTQTTLATVPTGTYGSGPNNFWQDVELDVTGTSVTVHIDGARVFNNVSLSGSALPSGEIGLISLWSIGSFNNVSVTPMQTTAYTDSFGTGSTTGWSVVSGTWSASSPAGSYTSTAYPSSNGASISVYGTTSFNTDYTFSGSVSSGWTAPGNRMGLVFNHVDANDYYDVLVSEAGTVELDKTISGTTTLVDTVGNGSFKGYGTNQWIDICVLKQGNGNTSIYVNGKAIFNNVALTQLGAGDIGYEALWNGSTAFQFTQVSNGQAPYKRVFPKLGQMITGGTQAYASYASTIAQYDLAILDMWNGYVNDYGTTPAQVVADIKADNASTLLGQYSDVMETVSPSTTGYPDYDVYSYLGTQTGPTGNGGTWTPNDWWARDNTGANVSEYSGTNETNLTYFVTPDSNNWRYPQWYANRENTVMYSTAPFDIWYSDNTFYQPRSNADWSRDGTNDSNTNSTVQTYYRQGIADYFQRFTQLEPGMLAMGNIDGSGASIGHLTSSTPEYQGFLPGGFQEGAMGASWSEETWAGWSYMMGSYNSITAGTAWPNLVLFSAYGTTTGTSSYDPTNYSGGSNYAFMRNALCSCMMENGYFAYSVGGNYDVTQLQPFDEYSVILGIPLQGVQTSAWSKGVYARQFQNGLVLANPRGNGSQTVNVTTIGNGTFKHFTGTQDSALNNGANVTTVTLGDGDGLVLINQ